LKKDVSLYIWELTGPRDLFFQNWRERERDERDERDEREREREREREKRERSLYQ
jgi:hypothetical protein